MNTVPQRLLVRARALMPITTLVLLGITLPGCADGQVPPDERASDALRGMLKVGPEDSLAVARDYSKPFYPAAVFYRAERVDCIDCVARVAAVVLVKDSLIRVADIRDIPGLWSVLGPPLTDAFQLRRACHELLYQTGILRRSDRLVDSAASIRAEDRPLLAPASGLTRIKPPRDETASGGHSTTFFVYNGFEVQEVSCSLRQGTLTASIDTVASSPRGG